MVKTSSVRRIRNNTVNNEYLKEKIKSRTLEEVWLGLIQKTHKGPWMHQTL